MAQNYLKGISILLCFMSMLAVNEDISTGQGSQAKLMNPSTEPRIKITNPVEGASVSDPVSVNGTILGEIPNDHYIWLLTTRELLPGMYYPQGSNHITPANGLWSSVAYLGGISGNRIGLVVALVDNGTDQALIRYAEESAALGDYPAIKFPTAPFYKLRQFFWRNAPEYAKIMDKITIVRK